MNAQLADYLSFWMLNGLKFRDWPTFVQTGTQFLELTDPTARVCVETQVQYMDALNSYKIDSSILIVYNFVYSLGVIYDIIVGIISPDDQATTDSEYYFQQGEKLGIIFNLVFASYGSYQYPYVEIVYPEQFDEDFI